MISEGLKTIFASRARSGSGFGVLSQPQSYCSFWRSELNASKASTHAIGLLPPRTRSQMRMRNDVGVSSTRQLWYTWDPRRVRLSHSALTRQVFVCSVSTFHCTVTLCSAESFALMFAIAPTPNSEPIVLSRRSLTVLLTPNFHFCSYVSSLPQTAAIWQVARHSR